MLSKFDSRGYAIPFTEDDAVIEAGACDPDYGPPEGWPPWCDDDRWESSPEDAAWLAAHPILPEPFEPTDADWDEMAAWSGGLFTDEDLAAAGLAVG